MELLSINKLQELRTRKQTDHTISLAYYDSLRKPKYFTDRLRDFFNKNPHYTQNWMSIVVDAVRNKLSIEGFNVGTPIQTQDGGEQPDPRQERLNEIWDNAQLNIEADLIHELCHATGEAFLVLSANSEGQPVAYAIDPRAVVVYYGSSDPRKITQAVYFWMDGETNMATAWTLGENGTVYEEVLKGSRRLEPTATPETQNQISYASTGEPVETAYRRIPVIHFRRSMRNIKPEFYQVQDIQDTINKTFAMQGFGVENTADKAKLIITNSDVSELAALQSGDIAAIAPAPHNTQPVTVTEFSSGDFQSLTGIIESGVMAIASITSTPRHLFSGEGLGAGISGEALQSMEAPLVAKVGRYTRLHAPQWEAAAAMLLQIGGLECETAEVTCNYADPRTTLAGSQAQARLANVNAGIPIITQLRSEGWRQNEIDQLLSDRATERPVELGEAELEQMYDMISQRTERIIEPAIATAIQAIADVALDEVISGNRLARIQAAGTAQ